MLLLGIALVIARGQPPAPDKSLIGLSPCELPCFYGVIPGTTDYNGVFDALADYTDALHDSRDLGGFPFVDAGGSRAMLSFELGDGDVVTTIRIWAFDVDAQIGQLSRLLAVEQPSHVYRTCGTVLPARFLLTFGASDQLLVELLVRDEITPQTSISLLDVTTAGARSLDSARTSFGCTVETGWLGFAPLWKYFAAK